ncbi:hypothetical protein HYC85_022618 [Camellia sinensis]|uniref:Uncharacterized protein n=1 Tax=Camellia sinensis TaxID=4442 RepID=A0A7J7GC79_CAMSI|nr:hypothetical protein HYC85_022618 [Camellia sinensis]
MVAINKPVFEWFVFEYLSTTTCRVTFFKTTTYASRQLHLSGLDGLKHLQELYLDYSFIDKIFLHNVGVMSSLRVLTLWNINLNGTLRNQGWCELSTCELSNLQELDLSENGFNGMLPSCLEDLTSIQILDLSFNQFIGNLTSSPLSNLTTLEYLILSYNHFESQSHLFHFVTIQSLRLSDQIEFQTWFLKFQLKVFSLSNCGSNNLGMKFPHFLFYQYDLRIVDLSHILVGTFRVWLLENNTRLKVFHLINCSLMGPFLLPSYPNPHANSIDIFDNHLEGPIPTNIDTPFLTVHKTSTRLMIYMVEKAAWGAFQQLGGITSQAKKQPRVGLQGFHSHPFHIELCNSTPRPSCIDMRDWWHEDRGMHTSVKIHCYAPFLLSVAANKKLATFQSLARFPRIIKKQRLIGASQWISAQGSPDMHHPSSEEESRQSLACMPRPVSDRASGGAHEVTFPNRTQVPEPRQLW